MAASVRFVFSVAFLVLFSSSLFAAPGRVGWVEGTAALAHRGSLNWEELEVNRPVVEGDRIILQRDALAEIELGDREFVRLGSDADLTVDELTETRFASRLHSGNLILRSSGHRTMTIETPWARFSVVEAGTFRLSVDASGGVSIAVRQGVAEAFTAVASRLVGEGEVLTIEGPDDLLRLVSGDYAWDRFDYWSDHRDAGRVGRPASVFQDERLAGMRDLDRYGDWSYVTGYGSVWWPRKSLHWRPFSLGRWAFIPGWGWSWISYEPWGWLPYHYGRWVFVPQLFRWCWVPGHFRRWSPAPVHFYMGRGFIGWRPLRPNEPAPSRGVLGDGQEVASRLKLGSPMRRFDGISASSGMSVVPSEEFGMPRSGGIPFESPSPEVLNEMLPAPTESLERVVDRLRMRPFNRAVGGVGESDAGDSFAPGSGLSRRASAVAASSGSESAEGRSSVLSGSTGVGSTVSGSRWILRGARNRGGESSPSGTVTGGSTSRSGATRDSTDLSGATSGSLEERGLQGLGTVGGGIALPGSRSSSVGEGRGNRAGSPAGPNGDSGSSLRTPPRGGISESEAIGRGPSRGRGLERGREGGGVTPSRPRPSPQSTAPRGGIGLSGSRSGSIPSSPAIREGQSGPTRMPEGLGGRQRQDRRGGASASRPTP